MMFLIVSRGSASVTEDTSVPGVPQLPEDGEGDGRPSADVEANRSRSIPDEVDGERDLKAQAGPNLSRAWAEKGEVCCVLQRDDAARIRRPRGDDLTM